MGIHERKILGCDGLGKVLDYHALLVSGVEKRQDRFARHIRAKVKAPSATNVVLLPVWNLVQRARIGFEALKKPQGGYGDCRGLQKGGEPLWFPIWEHIGICVCLRLLAGLIGCNLSQ